jgi:hypothetical protein
LVFGREAESLQLETRYDNDACQFVAIIRHPDGTSEPNASTRSSWPMPSGFRYSSSRISPGGIAGPSHLGSLTTRLNAFQELETIARRNEQIFKSARGVAASSASPNTGQLSF